MKDFECKCGRKQSYAPPDKSGGITKREAELVGWRKINGKWVCPFCSGNTKNLFKVFGGDSGDKGSICV